MVSSLYRKSTPARSACAPAWCDRLSTTWYIVFRRPVGLPDSVPNDATPAMLTAGPIGSVGGAFRSLYANCARVSLTVRGESVQVLPKAMRLIDVVEAGRRGRRVQRAGAARVVRRDVVEAVATLN